MSSEVEPGLRLKVVDALDLPAEVREVLRPGEILRDPDGHIHRLPRYFYEVPSHEAAGATALTAHFSLNEFILTDLRESAVLQRWPRYVPCAVRVLAFYLEQFRAAAGASVHVTVNGGYRSPAHRFAHDATLHQWGTAADIYRIGSIILRTQEVIEKYNAIAESVSDEIRVLPWGHEIGASVDDHLHIDIGYLTLVPREISDDPAEQPQEFRPRFAFEDRRTGERRAREEEGTRNAEHGTLNTEH